MIFVTITDSEIDTSQIGIDLAELYVRGDLAKTKSEVRRLIKQGAIRVNDRVVKDPFARIAGDDKDWFLVEKIIS